MYVPCCSIRAVSTAQATPDQHPEQAQIEQRPDFGNIAKRQTRPSPTQSTFSVEGALPGRRRAILAGAMHPPGLARQLGRARTAQGRGGEDVRSGRLLPGDQHTGRAPRGPRRDEATLGRRRCSVRMRRGCPTTGPLPGSGRAPAEHSNASGKAWGRGGLLFEDGLPAPHASRRARRCEERCCLQSLPAGKLDHGAGCGQGAGGRRLAASSRLERRAPPKVRGAEL